MYDCCGRSVVSDSRDMTGGLLVLLAAAVSAHSNTRYYGTVGQVGSFLQNIFTKIMNLC